MAPEDAELVFENIGFIPRPSIIRSDDMVVELLKKTIKDPENECHVHEGPIACGSSVVANDNIVETHILSQKSNTKGLEMESYGVAYAVAHAIAPRPHAIIAKSICDFANSGKDDKYQKFAAYTSCQYVKYLLEKMLPEI